MGAGDIAGIIIGLLIGFACVYAAYKYLMRDDEGNTDNVYIDIERDTSQGKRLPNKRKSDGNRAGAPVANPLTASNQRELGQTSIQRSHSQSIPNQTVRKSSESNGIVNMYDDEDEFNDTIENVYIEGIWKSGWLKKKSTRGVWLSRWFFLKEGRLFYVHKPTEMIAHSDVSARVVANMVISTVKEVSPLEFQIISPGQRGSSSGGGVYELQGEAENEVRDWIRMIRSQIESGLTNNLSSSEDDILHHMYNPNAGINNSDNGNNGSTTANNGSGSGGIGGSSSHNNNSTSVSQSTKFVPSRDYLMALADANPICADCGALNPEWASLNLCIMICIECSGIHRRLGTHISKVRSLTLDKWAYNNIQLLLQIGNTVSNSVWEAELPVGIPLKPTPSAPMEERHTYISEKYAERRYVSSSLMRLPDEKKSQLIVQAASTGDLKGCLSMIAVGADVNATAFLPSESVDGLAAPTSDPFAADTATTTGTALHAACMGGHTLCVELLCQNNASVDAVNSLGQTPMDIACENKEKGAETAVAMAAAVIDILELNGAKRR